MASEFIPYGPDSMMWKINRERVVLLCGPAAAILQAAHPQVAMGVAAHSHYRTDPFGRLRRTLDAVYTIAFGTVEDVEQARRVLARIHAAVKGQGYSAFDTGAQGWVLATLIMGSVTMYERFVGRLTTGERDQFLRENVRFGEVFGLDPDWLPTTWKAFMTYWQDMLSGSLLGSNPLCAEVTAAVLCPPAPWFARLLSPVFRSLTVEFIPAPLCQRLLITPSRLPLWSLLDHLLPSLLRVAPRCLRYARQYLQVA